MKKNLCQRKSEKENENDQETKECFFLNCIQPYHDYDSADFISDFNAVWYFL